jgi:anti-anti-sigma regulatory factor
MCSTILNPMETAFISTGELTELVRGQDQILIQRLSPVVRRQSVTLDLGSVERIDAAGIAALISLYTGAHDAGHRFTVSNPSARVEEILSLVGLEGTLVSHHMNCNSQSGSCCEQSAA